MSVNVELMRQATALHVARNPDAAARLYERVLANDPDDADALHLLGIARAQTGDHASAAALIAKAIERRADVAIYHLNLARTLSRLGDTAGMLAALKRAIALDDKDDTARHLLAQHLMPGANYIELMQKLHEWLRPATYVEIGVATGRSLALALPPTRTIGIDPSPRLATKLGTGTRIFQLTSDEFFANHDLAKELGRPTVDLAFIDGLHLFEQTLRDFINLERFAGPGSVILVHDCLPLDAASAARDRRGLFWTGDVWKLIPALRSWRPDLAIRTIATRPSGLALITGLDATSRVLAENFAAIVAQFIDTPVPLEPIQQEEQLARVDNDLVEIESYIRSRA
jgi:predicted O-methyltransferase YrrM